MATLFHNLQPAPPDAILGLMEAFLKDSRAGKINLSVGVYQDARGTTPTLECVREAERRLLEADAAKSYLPITGLAEYDAGVQELLFGEEHEIVIAGRASTAQTPGGTAAVRAAADTLWKLRPTTKVYISQPTWPNHPSIFAAAGLKVEVYPYFDADKNGLALAAMLAAMEHMPPGSAVLLHGGCHNPTGVDPTPDEWRKIAVVLRERNLLPLIDFAYQGFAEGIREDARGISILCGPGQEAIICSSFSKNFGLYSERVGALTLVAEDRAAAETAMSHAKTCIRANYSNPPAHGARIVAAILADPQLRGQWEEEVAGMRRRINGMRKLFVETMKACGSTRDWSFIERQRGMFSFSGLNPVQVDRLRSEFAIYVVGNGRINVAGMTEGNIMPLCRAIAAVTQ
ncbi:MAG: aspartate/tyrosine/aromatic aminotransferase [Planctomycetes bacterium]|nr:aspartate/tyrosine/aromatic aminotransferase [Planctomycetota bacterium]